MARVATVVLITVPIVLCGCEIPVNFVISDGTIVSSAGSDGGGPSAPTVSDGGASPTQGPDDGSAPPTSAPFDLILEAENMPIRNAGANRAVEGGWALLSNGSLEQDVSFPEAGTYGFDLRARATLANGVGARTELRIDGSAVGSVIVNSSDYSSSLLSAQVAAGTHRVAIAFTNDFYDAQAGVDRNLYVDRIEITSGSASQSGGSDTTSGTNASGTTAGWTHEPSSVTVITDNPWDELTPAGWGINNKAGLASIISDPTAPYSPSHVLEMRYPIGFSGDGVGPAESYYIFKSAPRELYIGFYWKVSNPWQGHISGVNKIMFAMFPNGENIDCKMDGVKGGPYYIRCTTETNGIARNLNAQNKIPVQLGVWHKLEFYLRMDSTHGAGDGIARWWMDDQQIANYTDVSYSNYSGFEEFQFAPTWGGRGDGPKQENDYYRFDHVRLSGR